MNIREYVKDKWVYLLCHGGTMLFTVASLYVLFPQGGKQFAFLLGFLYLFAALIPLYAEYLKKKRYYQTLEKTLEQLDQKNLLTEVIPRPDFFDGKFMYDALKISNKFCLEEIKHHKGMQSDYREYIEMWMHEVKTPIASSKLIVQNNPGPATSSISEELDSIENYLEQALYYARSNTVENDYLIRELPLEQVVVAALKRDSALLIRSGISIATEGLALSVFSDSKWLEFILHQLIINSVKYAAEKSPRILITGRHAENACILSFSDNGIGIPEKELPKVFDKGFTGTNGRLRGKSTGMGLYICQKLCTKLGLGISVFSGPEGGTTMELVFPKSSMTAVL